MLTVKLKEFLSIGHVGEKNAVSSRELEKYMGCCSREIRDAVSILRTEGVPICSSSKGYWFAVDDAEIRQTMARLRSWIKSMNVALEGLDKCLAVHYANGIEGDEEIVELELS